MSSKTVFTEIQVRYGDLDPLGHVNNAAYLSYLEMGRMKFLREHLPEYDPMMANIVLARIEIDFKKSIMLDDAITLETSIESMGRTSVRFLQRIVAESSEEPYSVAKVTAVFIDRNRRPVPVPEAIRNIYSDGSGNVGNPPH